jgi:glucan phosphoethanolaminetransferase (alkaline phosphatase superfamily)
MIQRIQSVFLLLAAVLNGLAIFLPLWQFIGKYDHEVISGMGIIVDFHDTTPDVRLSFSEHVPHILFFVTSMAATAMLLFTLLRFSDRALQMRLCVAALALLMVSMAALVWLAQQGPFKIGAAESTAHYGFFFPIVAMLFAWLALRAIRKDEELVRSVNRIR